METYAHIVAVGVADGTYGRKFSEYQITLNAGGVSWARTLEGDRALVSFLESSLALRKDIVDEAVRKLSETGHAMISAVELPENEAPALGFQKTPIDF
jgi:hypothetical protein